MNFIKRNITQADIKSIISGQLRTLKLRKGLPAPVREKQDYFFKACNEAL